ncbi:hypothetical protein NQZ68_003448 [Dissostichus eleginoides]|nr:hypothetical protein NQZ68_003448 [Dissostichus eleginoides]
MVFQQNKNKNRRFLFLNCVDTESRASLKLMIVDDNLKKLIIEPSNLFKHLARTKKPANPFGLSHVSQKKPQRIPRKFFALLQQ